MTARRRNQALIDTSPLAKMLAKLKGKRSLPPHRKKTITSKCQRYMEHANVEPQQLPVT